MLPVGRPAVPQPDPGKWSTQGQFEGVEVFAAGEFNSPERDQMVRRPLDVE